MHIIKYQSFWFSTSINLKLNECRISTKIRCKTLLTISAFIFKNVFVLVWSYIPLIHPFMASGLWPFFRWNQIFKLNSLRYISRTVEKTYVTSPSRKTIRLPEYPVERKCKWHHNFPMMIFVIENNFDVRSRCWSRFVYNEHRFSKIWETH